jgi:transposase
MDNAGAHKAPASAPFSKSIARRASTSPSYSPELNPIELAWSKVQELLRSAKARTIDELNAAMKAAIGAVSESDAAGWFAHCG